MKLANEMRVAYRGIVSPQGFRKELTSRLHDEGQTDPFDTALARDLVENGFLSSEDIGSFEAPLQTVESYPQLGYLWVYEPQDLNDLTLDEVQLIWENRETLCGSREVAAEALAIVEVATGAVETYQGWMAYLEREEVISLTPEVEPSVLATADTLALQIPFQLLTPVSSPDDNYDDHDDDDHLEFPALRRMDLAELTEEDLQDAWNRRPESFSSLEAACGALALLRSLAGIESDAGWQRLMEHSEIQKLADDLPDRDDEDEILPSVPAPPAITTAPPAPRPDDIRLDQRTRRQSDTVVREGQQAFRQEVLANYHQRCCVTGCRESVILEAAHISPYTGLHSNHPANGLCLRVDIHRLFDAFLVSFEPLTQQLVIADRLRDDPAYAALHSKLLASGRVPASRELLAEHFKRFLAHNPEMATIQTLSVET